MDNKGGADLVKERIRPFPKCHAGNHNPDGGFSVRAHVQVLQIAQVMALRVVPAMLLALWVEVGAGGLEIRRFTPSHRMNVEAVKSG